MSQLRVELSVCVSSVCCVFVCTQLLRTCSRTSDSVRYAPWLTISSQNNGHAFYLQFRITVWFASGALSCNLGLLLYKNTVRYDGHVFVFVQTRKKGYSFCQISCKNAMKCKSNDNVTEKL